MKQPGDHIQTRRLTLRRFTRDDSEVIERLHGDPDVMRHVGGAIDRAKAQALLDERILAYYEQHPGLGIWATLDRDSGACIGLHLLNHVRGEAFIQLGYLLFPRYWGHGYATEMGTALLRYGFSELGLAQIVGITNLANVASQHVLLKCGLHRHGERRLAHPAYADQGPLAWFERDAADWLAEAAADRAPASA